MPMLPDYTVKATRGGLSLKIDRDIAQSLVVLLDTLKDLLVVIRSKAAAQAAEKKARSARLRKKQEKEFNSRSIDALKKYMIYLEATDSPKAARAEVARDLKLERASDVDIFLARGRKLTGTPKKQLRREKRSLEMEVV